MTTTRSTTAKSSRRPRRRPARSGSKPANTPSHATRRPTPPAFEPVAHDPTPIAFEHLPIHRALKLGVADRGFEQTTPIQSAVFPIVRDGHDLIACAETGTGKTAAFLLPIMDRMLGGTAAEADPAISAKGTGRTRGLVLAPTRELAVQIDDDFQGFGYHTTLTSVAVYGGVPMDPQERALKAGADLVIATPGRLMDHMRSGHADFSQLEVLVLDEADRMLDMGFWPDVQRIVSALPIAGAVDGDGVARPIRQTLLLSATMPDEIMVLARQIMRDPRFIQVGSRGAPATTITHSAEFVPSAQKPEWLARFLQRARGRSLVFVRTKIGAERLARRLAGLGIKAAALHADRSQAQRTAAVEGFRSGRHLVLVATDIAARGLDIDAIEHVINFEVPTSTDTYVHRVGRTGRAEAAGHALTLAAPEERRALEVIERSFDLRLQGGRPPTGAQAPAPVRSSR